MRRTCVLLLTLFALPARLPAQRLAPSPFAPTPRAGPPALRFRATPPDAAVQCDVDESTLIIGGILGATAGVLAGAAFGHRYDQPPCEDCIDGLLHGALVGEALGAPLGVHVANRGRGDFGPSIAASLAIAAVGWWALNTKARAPVLIAVPIAQIGAAIGFERRAVSRQTVRRSDGRPVGRSGGQR